MNTYHKYTKINGIKETDEIKEIKYKLQFDGCSKGNPGLSGAGYVIYENETEIFAQAVFVGNSKTNNYAEYIGLIEGLKKAIEFNITDLFVEGDSMLVIKQMKGEYKVSSESLKILYAMARDLELKFEIISYNHIYREKNTRADYLSNLGLITKN
jgi:ribonuclease HI